MLALTADEIWRLEEKELLILLDSNTQSQRSVRFYVPSFSYYKTREFCSSPNLFPTVSVTGSSCALNCKHCGGKVLETMQPTQNATAFFEQCQTLKQKGALGVLVSGGCLPDGSVPLKPFLPAIGRVKRELGLTVFVHTGIIDTQTAISLKAAGVDAALIDVIGSQETINKVYNLDVTVSDYAKSLKALNSAGLSFVPHVLVGLNNGILDGELEALKMIQATWPSAIVIIAFMPIRGTEMEQVAPPKPADIARVAACARKMFPQTPIVLGCMRPKGKARVETDILALKAGVDGIAFPSQEAVKYAQEQGLGVCFSSYCCAQIYLDFAVRSASK
jgi:lipoyl synthase